MNKNTLFTTCMMALTMCFSTLTAADSNFDALLKERLEAGQAVQKSLAEGAGSSAAAPNPNDSAATGGSASTTVVPSGEPVSPPTPPEQTKTEPPEPLF